MDKEQVVNKIMDELNKYEDIDDYYANKKNN